MNLIKIQSYYKPYLYNYQLKISNILHIFYYSFIYYIFFTLLLNYQLESI